MALDGTHTVGSSGHVSDHNLIDQTLADHATQIAAKLNSADAASTYATKTALVFNVKDYGAVGDANTDDTSAISSAVSACSNAGGGTVYLPGGQYKVNAAITLPAGVSLRGQNSNSTALHTASATNVVLTLGDTCTVRDLAIDATVTRTAGALISIQGSQCVVDGCLLKNYYLGVRVGVNGGYLAPLPRITNCVFSNPVIASGGGGIFLEKFSSPFVSKIIMTGGSGTQADYGIRVWEGDTWFISDVNIVSHGRGLQVDPPAGISAFAGQISNGMFDSAGTISGGTTVSSCAIIPAGFVYDVTFSNTWFGNSASQAGCDLVPAGSGVIDGVQLTGCLCPHNGASGLRVSGSGVKNWSVNGGVFAGNTNYGIDVSAATTNFTITGTRCGPAGGHGANAYGINIAASASDGYVITGNNLRGNTSAGIYDGGTGTNKVLANNLTA